MRVSEDELEFRFSRSSGPGGQNVNCVETRVTLLFDIRGSESLSEYQKHRVRQRLATRINRDDVLRVSSQKHRTRDANRRATLERFDELIEAALRVEKPRRKTKVSRSAKKRRLEQKRRRGDIKRGRGSASSDD